MQHKTKIIIRVLILCSFSAAFGQSKKELKVLFVGNSYIYVNNVSQLVSLISDSSKTRIIARKSVVGGAKLSEHWNSRRGLQTRQIIEKGNFDAVVLQDHSMGTINEPDSTLYYITLFSQLIASKKATAYLFVTWAREKVPQQQEQINNIYLQAAKENKITVIPIGPAWQAALKIRPTVELHSGDGSHANQLGSFLEACVMAAVLTNEVPKTLRNDYWTKDIDGESVHLMNLDPLDIEFCLKVTDRTIKEFKQPLLVK